MLRPQPLEPVPDETARVARAAFPAGNLSLRMRDALGTLYEDTAFAPLFSPQGRPAAAAWRLALVTVVQFAEDLSDRQAADAVRARIDLKYALALPLEDAGFDHTVLSEFRSRLVAGEAAPVLLEALLERCRRLGLLKAHGRQRRTPRTCWRPCGPSTAWSWCGRRWATPWRSSPAPSRTGCAPTRSRSG